MKKLVIFIALLASAAAFAATPNGKLQRSESEQSGKPPSAATTYDRDCVGNGKPRNMRATLVAVASGVGSVTTITETDTINTWVSTVDTSVAGTTISSCSQLQ